MLVTFPYILYYIRVLSTQLEFNRPLTLPICFTHQDFFAADCSLQVSFTPFCVMSSVQFVLAGGGCAQPQTGQALLNNIIFVFV